MTLERALDESPELRALYEEDPQVAHLIDRGRRLEGIARHAGTHAAGIVISSDPLVQHLPLQRPPRGDDEQQFLPTTQFPMETVAEIGLLKMDFLGLSNLTILGEAVEIVKQTRGESLDPKCFPDHDVPTYAMLGKGETFGVFQLESAGMRRGIQELRPESVGELAAMVALYRPGPMQHIPRFCRAKHGIESIDYPHSDLSDVLDETYGVIVYQDQVLLIAQKFAGYTLGEADIMRKAMGKKIAEKMKSERERFIQGARERGYSADDAIKIFDLIEPFAGYAFNKAHAVCYGTISYQTAYLKANYPAEYMTAVLRLAPSHPSGPAARVAAAAAECMKLGIELLPPSVNHSDVRFQVEEQGGGQSGIRFGLSIIKNVGEAAVEALVAARAKQPDRCFASLYDLCVAVDQKMLNRRVLESLIKAGACDEFGHRAQLLASLDRVLASAHAQQRAVQRGQMDLFGGAMVVEASALDLDDTAPIAKKTLLAWEKEHVGVYLTENPLADIQRSARRMGHTFVNVTDLDSELAGRSVRLLALVTEVRRITTRTQRQMAVATVEDLTGSIEVVLFPQCFEQFSEILQEDAALILAGKVDVRNDELQLLADEVRIVEEEPVQTMTVGRLVRLRFCAADARDADRLYRLAELLREFQGEDELIVTLDLDGGTRSFRLGQRVDWCTHLATAVEELLGEATRAMVRERGSDEIVSVMPSRAAQLG
jgi:DNA polymerase-3 subunit alpha